MAKKTRPELRQLEDVIGESRAFARNCRDRLVRRRDLAFVSDPGSVTKLRVQAAEAAAAPEGQASDGPCYADVRITTPCLRRVASHFKAPYDYLRKYPIQGEMAEHLTVLAHAKQGRRIVRMVRSGGDTYLRGLMRADKTPLDTCVLLTTCRGIIEQLPGFGGVEVHKLPEPDGSRNRARLIVPFGGLIADEPPLRAIVEIVNDECDAISVSIGFTEAEGDKMGILGHMTRRIVKEGPALGIARRGLKVIQTTVTKGISLKDVLEEQAGLLPLSTQELAQILAATRTFPGGFAERLALYDPDDCRTVRGAFAALLDAAEGLPEQVRRSAQKRAWALLVTGFRSILHCKARESRQGAYLVQA